MPSAVSIVVCTHNRGATLPAMLRSYDRIVASVQWELVVVDNASTDGTFQFLTDYSATANFEMRVLREPRLGKSRAVNTGWRACTAPIIALTDDDCYPASDYVDCLVSAFESTDISYLGGRVLLYDPLDYPITIQLCSTVVDLPPYSFVPAGTLHGANMAARRVVFETTGGFDERMGPGARVVGEDIDFACRASFSGFHGRYDPRPTISHHHRRRDPVDVERLMYSYDLGRGAYYMSCFLDSRRRVEMLKHRFYWRKMYWSARRLLQAPRKELPRLRSGLTELHGALLYLADRLS